MQNAFLAKPTPQLKSRVHTYIIEFHLIFCFSDAFQLICVTGTNREGQI